MRINGKPITLASPPERVFESLDDDWPVSTKVLPIEDIKMQPYESPFLSEDDFMDRITCEVCNDEFVEFHDTIGPGSDLPTKCEVCHTMHELKAITDGASN